MIVEVYWNSRRKQFSVRHKGRVINSARCLTMKGVKFIVQKGGQERVWRTKQKNIHAFLRGELSDGKPTTPARNISYNPYANCHFIDEAGNFVFTAPFVCLAVHQNRPMVKAHD